MTLALPSRRPTPAWVRDGLWRRARAVPSLDLRFADSKSLVDAISGQSLVTFTRSSDGTYVGSDGLLKTAATNEPRFDHNPTTGECLGLLVEEQRTNSIRNNTMQGAVAGTPGTLPTNWSLLGGTGLTTEIVGIGTENGITYLDLRFSGTTGNTFTGFQFDVGSHFGMTTATAYTASVYLKRVAGSLTNLNQPGIYIRYNLSPSGQIDISASVGSLAAPTAALAQSRYAVTGTTTGTLSGVGAVFLLFNHSSGVAVNLTLRIGMPQIEQGSFATSVIPTTSSAATRNADVAEIVQQALAAGIRTLYAELRSPASGTRGVVSLNDNTANERAAINTSGTDPRLVVVDGGATQADIDAGTIAANARSRIAVRIAADNFAASFNGGAVVTDTSGTLPTVDRLFIGRTQAGEYLNAPIARLVGWREELPDSALQALTQ